MEQPWFTAKKYGYGWQPASREGWLVTIAFMAYLLWLGFNFDIEADIPGFFFRLTAAIVLLLIICYKTGEKPEWRWG